MKYNIIDQQAEHVNEMCNQFEFLENNGPESDLFVVFNSNSKNIAKNLEDLKVALKSRAQTEVSFQKSSLKSEINSLGTITVDTINEEALAGKPWDITVVPDLDEAWITISESSCIQHVDADSMNVDPSIKVPKCYGITMVDDNIALGRWGEVVIINKDGIHVKQLEFGKGIIHSLSSGINGTIYCCEGEDGMFRCVRLLDEKVMFT
ncbi:unnamed protein product [Mytilus coruscus]|uniref:Uncharacterized protein n=1 Tax=Mytilus coruscus TaxID=42192 RepID=A0A6J8EX88_MYTCO|nr:unnamed protein product [Mytilus coruscus]